jgi:cyclopropane fatty-acyl-phospholipid synthase-like methyltransferase
MNEPTTWHESDDFWETVAPFMFGEDSWASAPAEVDQVTAVLDLQPGTSILDLGCGPGRHSLELARRGFHVTGVDRTTVYLEQARQRAEAEGLTIEFVQEDMRRFCRPDAFNAALSMFTSFGYFDTPADNQQVLVNVYASLKKGGRFIIELMGKEVLARIFQTRDWQEHDGVFFLQDRQVHDNWTKMKSRWILLKGSTHYEFNVSHWIYSAAELTAMLRDSGFSTVDVYGSSTGTPYDNTARRLVVVAHKGGE